MSAASWVLPTGSALEHPELLTGLLSGLSSRLHIACLLSEKGTESGCWCEWGSGKPCPVLLLQLAVLPFVMGCKGTAGVAETGLLCSVGGIKCWSSCSAALEQDPDGQEYTNRRTQFSEAFRSDDLTYEYMLDEMFPPRWQCAHGVL